MFVEDVRALFDQYVDEPDLTFLSVQQRRDALSRAYNSFRQVVIDGDHFAYNRTQDFALSSTDSLDLTTSTPALLGSTAAAGVKMLRLRRVAITNSQNNVWQFLEAVRTLDPVLPRQYVDQWQDEPTRYALVNDSILLSRKIEGTLRLYYLPSQDPTIWANDTAGSNQYIDDYEQFHKLIAMYAARDYYTTRDGETAQRLEAQIYLEEQRMRGFLMVGRDTEANSQVAERF